MIKTVAGLLMAANAAGAIEAAKLALENGGGRVPAMLFTSGFVMAFAGAVTFYRFNRRIEKPHLEMTYYQTRAEFSGERDGRHEAMLQAEIKRVTRFLFVPPLMAGVAALLFFVGTMMITFS